MFFNEMYLVAGLIPLLPSNWMNKLINKRVPYYQAKLTTIFSTVILSTYILQSIVRTIIKLLVQKLICLILKSTVSPTFCFHGAYNTKLVFCIHSQRFATRNKGSRVHWAVYYTSPRSFICWLNNLGDLNFNWLSVQMFQF